MTSVASQDVVDNFDLCYSHAAVGFIVVCSCNTKDSRRFSYSTNCLTLRDIEARLYYH